MKSSTPKVLHEVCGRTMLGHVLAAARELAPAAAGRGGRRRRAARWPGTWPSTRPTPRPSCRAGAAAPATRCGWRRMASAAGPASDGTVVVTYGDTPLLRGQTLRRAGGGARGGRRRGRPRWSPALMTRPGYGRIVRDAAGRFAAIVEQADATPEQAAIDEINTGMYAFDGAPAGRRARAGCPPTTPRARSTSPRCCRSCAATAARSAPCGARTSTRSWASTTRPSWPGRAGC